jgi:hypothetical protein
MIYHHVIQNCLRLSMKVLKENKELAMKEKGDFAGGLAYRT